jgi:hypothetical protein
MLHLSASRAEHCEGTNMHAYYPGDDVIPRRAVAPANLDAARQAFAEYRADVEAAGKPAHVSAYWKKSPDRRAPAGLQRAIDHWEFRAYVNL